MSRFNQASHVFWRCQYHIEWTPKYRFRISKNNVDGVGINEEIIRRYVGHQEKEERVDRQQLALD